MRRLVCTFVIREPSGQVFSRRGPCYALLKINLKWRKSGEEPKPDFASRLYGYLSIAVSILLLKLMNHFSAAYHDLPYAKDQTM